jgi:hypothetical protein
MVSLSDIFLPTVANASTDIPTPVLSFMGKIYSYILNPIIALLFAMATLYFIYGVVAFIWSPDNAELREKGRLGMIWGIVGMFIMVSVFSIMRLLATSIGGDTTQLFNTI